MSDGFWEIFFLASFLVPFRLEYWLHKRVAARLAPLAFVDVGRRPLAHANERVVSSRETYRAGERHRGAPLLPPRAWSLRGPNDGTIEITVDASRRHAIVRIDVPWKRWTGLVRPTSAVATIRIEPVADGARWALRATALPQGLVLLVGIPFFAAALASPPHPLLIFGVVLLMVSIGTALLQAHWWRFHGGRVRESAALALDTVGHAVEAESAPIAHATPESARPS